MPYSELADLDGVVPGASVGWLLPNGDPDDLYTPLSVKACNEIHGIIGWGTATPVVDSGLAMSLAEIEALLIAHRLASGVYAARDQEGGETYRGQFRGRAVGILEQLIFPASASVPAPVPGFTVPAGLTLGVEVFDGFTAPAQWLVVVTKTGTVSVVGGLTVGDAELSVWNSRDDSRVTWSLSSSVSWPTRAAADDVRGLNYQVRLSMGYDEAQPGAATLTAGDAWSFRSFSRWRKRMHRGLRMVDTRRGGSGRI